MIRVHGVPRKKLFKPAHCEDLSVPIASIDVTRYTKTYLENADDVTINDIWGTDDVERELSEPWVGETKFDKLLRAPAGYEIDSGRVTRTQETNRPGDFWPEIWRMFNAKQKKAAIKDGQARKRNID